MSDVLDLMWGELQDELSKQKAEAEVALSRSERAETAGGILACAFAVLPYLADGASDGDLRFVTDACKVGELVGAGTGTPCYFDEGTNTWLRVEDDAAPLSAGGSGGAIPGFAVPSIALGTAAAGGAAGTVIRSDATIVAFDATNPAASAPGDAVVVGVAAYAARRDHRHAREAWGVAGDIGAETFGASAAAGVTSKVADAGHVHSLPIPVTLYGSRGLTGVNNAGTPNTKMDFAADYVHLTNASQLAVVRTSTGTITCDVGAAGPVANGRDQAGAFGAGSWIYFYFIWNGATLATIASATAPPTGPTLPGGYTYWCYAGSNYFNGSSHLLAVHQMADTVYYDEAQIVVNDTTATRAAENTASVAAACPPGASTYAINGYHYIANTAVAIEYLILRSVSGLNSLFQAAVTAAAGAYASITIAADFPNLSQQFFWLWTDNTGTSSGQTTFIVVNRYSIPNGGR